MKTLAKVGATSNSLWWAINGVSLLVAAANAAQRCARTHIQTWFCYAGRRTKFAPGKSLWFFEFFLELSHFELRSTVFFTLGCGVDSWIPHLQLFQTVEGKAPKEAWGGHLSGEGINVTFLHLHEPHLSAMRCVTLNQIDPTYMICVRSFVLCPHYSTLSSPLPFRCDKISRKGQVFWSFAGSGCIRKLFEV